MIEYTCVTCTEQIKCPHANGWYHTVTFWIFKRRFFFCSDCGEAVKLKEQAK